MNEIYVIEYDNGEEYSDHSNWIGDKFFLTHEEAENAIFSEGFEVNEDAETDSQFTYCKERFLGWDFACITKLTKG